MKKLSKLTLRNVNVNDLMSDKEMKNVLGGGSPGQPGDVGGVAKGCADHKEPSSCFGPCSEIVGGESREGKCKWTIVPAIGYGGCACWIP